MPFPTFLAFSKIYHIYRWFASLALLAVCGAVLSRVARDECWLEARIAEQVGELGRVGRLKRFLRRS
jgi:hypothetical protein